MSKLILRDSCFNGVKGKLSEIKISPNHKELVKQAKIEIEKGNLKYAKAIVNSTNYCIDQKDFAKVKRLIKNK